MTPLVEGIIKFRASLEYRLRALHIPIPPKEPWDDDVTYNNTLLELLEEAKQ